MKSISFALQKPISSDEAWNQNENVSCRFYSESAQPAQVGTKAASTQIDSRFKRFSFVTRMNAGAPAVKGNCC